ncbi:hypothetical protein [Sphingomonas bacterium]|uniref:hypothetical protein n=1 Tax=Sphingomonas bacterium TaxID=1895847 RepID=UPI002628FA3C|nr:hypothetical protein [Sphingomonas bacterium]MDB5679836.1 hypothetical protein [Sphingomonas bacterium]
MRPRSIIWFERLIFVTLILGMFSTILNWDSIVARTALTESRPVAFVLIVQTLTFAMIIGLTLLTSRRRSRIAMWVSIVLTALGLPVSILMLVHNQFVGSVIIPAIQMLTQFVAFGLLFTPNARAWMRRKGNMPNLQDTFS